MLKACCDCIAAGIREEREAYGTQLNGSSLGAPLWPEPTFENETMFVLPTRFKYGDHITINGVLNINPQRLLLTLQGDADNKPDHRNISCHIEFTFISESKSNNDIILKVIENGEEIPIPNDGNLTSLDVFPESSSAFSIKLQNTESSLDIYVGESFVGRIPSRETTGTMKYLILQGDVKKVEKLEFEFA